MRWLVDGMNVIGSRPTGWWRDRPRAMRELTAELEAFARRTGERVTVVFDGEPFEIDGGDVEVLFASRRGPHAADDDIAERTRADTAPGGLTVVSSDSELVRRVEAAGANTVGAGCFRRRLERGSAEARGGYLTRDPKQGAAMESEGTSEDQLGGEQSGEAAGSGGEGGFSSGGEGGQGEAGGSSFGDEGTQDRRSEGYDSESSDSGVGGESSDSGVSGESGESGEGSVPEADEGFGGEGAEGGSEGEGSESSV